MWLDDSLYGGVWQAVVVQDGLFGQVLTSSTDMIVHLPCDRRYRTG
ncbi:hypothetical protein AWG98_21060 [Escherichia coli]|nr:hypothetical protein AWG98_21060 [Escherichia coli]